MFHPGRLSLSYIPGSRGEVDLLEGVVCLLLGLLKLLLQVGQSVLLQEAVLQDTVTQNLLHFDLVLQLVLTLRRRQVGGQKDEQTDRQTSY